MQFFEQQALQALENALLRGVYAGLGEEAAKVDILDFEPQFIFGGRGKLLACSSAAKPGGFGMAKPWCDSVP
jgi:hypothetical protein